MPNPTAEQVAEQCLDQIHHATYRQGGDQIERRQRRSRIIAEALTTFAQAREQAVWEEAAQRMESLRGNEILFNTIWNNLAEEFRRRAKGTPAR